MTRRAAPDRIARGLVVAAVGLGVALAGHAHAGGPIVLAPLAGVAALAVAVGCVVASREVWSARRLLLALVAMQIAVHGSMWLSGPARAVDPRLAAYVDSGSTHSHGDTSAMTVGMLLAHVVAIAVAAALLAGLDAVGEVLRALAHVVALLWRGSPRPVRASVSRLPGEHSRPDAGVLLRRTLSHRGPPALLASR